jgi:hypothetical protein
VPWSLRKFLLPNRLDRDGNWQYTNKDQNENLIITVHLPDGSSALIEQLSVNETRVTLGMSSCPSATPDDLLPLTKAKESVSALWLMQDKVLQWVNLAKLAHLWAPDMHFCMRPMLWTKVKYVLCAILDPMRNSWNQFTRHTTSSVPWEESSAGPRGSYRVWAVVVWSLLPSMGDRGVSGICPSTFDTLWCWLDSKDPATDNLQTVHFRIGKEFSSTSPGL